MQTKVKTINALLGILLPVFLLGQGNPSINEETAAELAAGKYTVAVLDFEGRGISVMEAQTLTDRFNTAMAGTDAVIMVERGTMMDVLDEQGFDSGGCTSDECAAEVGAMLGVQFMISGSIGKLGETYTIDDTKL